MYRPQTAFVILLSGAAFLARAHAADIDQNGDYLFTITRDNGIHSHTLSREVSQRAMERLSQWIPERMSRMQDRYEARIARGRGCDAGGSFANDASVNQSGASDTASVTQLGSNDTAAVSQYGVDDTAHTLQFGNDQQATTIQRGDHDLAVIIQPCRPARGRMFDGSDPFPRPYGQTR